MTIRKIATVGHPVLRQRARELTTDELAAPAAQQLIDDLIETIGQKSASLATAGASTDG